MRNLIKNIQRRLMTGFVAFFSTISVSIARVEDNPQSCGMMSMDVKRNRKASTTVDTMLR
ncbi:hypothetical protein [Mucilaginibacter sp. SP1R1]|uniref:hypothetical protein n=1 Tax=Mucilaginibacter sp. SP1R1 TaxID=2723091 RepID=UPI00161FA4CB|nr:hypothetical protein [Mucilaginibacter sp. SP1R1]MBB6149688.1 hypothetical protein [Mucilaginibacter sp. SP1R1]